MQTLLRFSPPTGLFKDDAKAERENIFCYSVFWIMDGRLCHTVIHVGGVALV